jgi:hypothetical protein
MVFFVSKESKRLTVLTGILGFIGATVGIAGSILLYKFTYGYPELRIPGMAIALFLGMWSVPRFCHWATWIPHRICCDLHAIARRTSSLS